MRLTRNRVTAVVLLAAALTAAVVAVPSFEVAIFAPDLRIVIEVVALCVALFTALALLVPGRDGTLDPACPPFVAALVTLGVGNALFGVGPVLFLGETTTGNAVTFYSWMATRYLASGLFVVAGLPVRPRSVRWYLVLAGAAIVLITVVAAVLGDRLPPPLPLGDLADVRGGMAVDVSDVVTAVAVTGVPGLLFAAGAVLAWRVWLRSGQQIQVWLSVALWIRVLAQVHELLYPTVLGPVVTSADLFRALAFGVLLIGSVRQVRGILVQRTRALHQQADDLRVRDELLASMRAFTEREEAFRYVVTHELSTPIAVLRGFARLLTDPPSSAVADEALRGIEAESGRLQQLVGRMEGLRRLEMEGFECELRPVLLGPLLQDAAIALRGLDGDHLARVQCDDDLRVRADPVRLGQALRNLLANAARYSPPGTPITLRAERRPGGRVGVVVEDRGPGIPPEERTRVRQKYVRGSTTGGADGAGLGLYVAERIAAAHGGRLLLQEPAHSPGLRAVVELEAL